MSCKVMLIDDDEATREVISLALGDEGFEVLTAANGRDAFQMLGDTEPDLILLDMRMPVMNGWEFSREVRKRFGKRIPIVAFTAAVDTPERAHEIEAEGYVEKPFILDDLFSEVRRVLALS